MKRILCLILVFLLAAVPVLTGCEADDPPPDLDNYPYEPDTPAPAAHDGVFVSEHGSLTFNGDGSTVVIDFDRTLAELTGLPEGKHEGTYVFMSGDLPPHGKMPVRYDTAFEMHIQVDGQWAEILAGITDGGSVTVGTNIVTPERIPFCFTTDEGDVGIVFVKQT